MCSRLVFCAFPMVLFSSPSGSYLGSEKPTNVTRYRNFGTTCVLYILADSRRDDGQPVKARIHAESTKNTKFFHSVQGRWEGRRIWGRTNGWGEIVDKYLLVSLDTFKNLSTPFGDRSCRYLTLSRVHEVQSQKPYSVPLTHSPSGRPLVPDLWTQRSKFQSMKWHDRGRSTQNQQSDIRKQLRAVSSTNGGKDDRE